MKRLTNLIIVVLFFSLYCFSCKDDHGDGAFSNFLRKEVIDAARLSEQIRNDSFMTVYDLIGTDSTFLPQDYAILYKKEAIWLDQYGVTKKGQALLNQIKWVHLEGLKPDDYDYHEVDSLVGQLENLNIGELVKLELKLSHAYLKLGRDLLLGRITPLAIDKNWQNKNDSTWSVDSMAKWVSQRSVDSILEALRPAHPWYKKFRSTARKLQKLDQFAIQIDELPETLTLGDSSAKVQTLRRVLARVVDTALDKSVMVWDTKALDALKKYQTEYGLEKTGELDSITLASLTQRSEENIKQLGMNMERIRWLQKDFLDEFIWVNIPQMEVRYFEGDDIKFQMNAVVGRVSRKTPTLDSKLSDIVFNPPWFVPPTILRREIVPGIARRGGAYLRRRGLVARDRRGRRVNPARINSRNYRRFSISQNPGRNSALGSVKFNFPNKEAIFLHDTNHRGGFTRKYRASSSGCIRVHHPKDFARFILRDSTFNADGIDSIIRNRATKSIKIKRDIGVHLVYLTNAVDSAGHVIKVNDIYKWDEKLAAKL